MEVDYGEAPACAQRKRRSHDWTLTTSPRSRAARTACNLLDAPSLRRTWPTCDLTVPMLMFRPAQIVLFEQPSHNQDRTSSSRGVRRRGFFSSSSNANSQGAADPQRRSSRIATRSSDRYL